MRILRITTLVAVALLAMTAAAQSNQMTINDDVRQQTITVTAVSDDILRVDVEIGRASCGESRGSRVNVQLTHT